MARLFGTDGVRGEANRELTVELAYRLGRAAALLFGEETQAQPTILIGRDTRISGPMLEAALSAGICSAGGKVVIAGVIPTPAIAFLAQRLGAQAGIVISASHNPFHDNGIKFFGGDGYKLPDAVEDRLEEKVRAIEAGDDFARPIGAQVGTIEYHDDLDVLYMEYLLKTVDCDFKGMKIVLDCANGAAYDIMPKLLRRLGAEVFVMNSSPDGVNINDRCGSTHLEHLQEAVRRRGADIGVAHDGDADRCLAVDETGAVIDGDRILVLCALDMMRRGALKDNTVVTTVMANIGFHKALKEIGARAEITKVGDRYVLENMLANGYALGGEQSGHIIFRNYSTTGDGLLTALQLIASLKKSGKRASELAALMTSYPQLLVNVKVATKDGWEDNPHIAAAIEAGEKELGADGRILVRPSGTEPLIRVMAEGPDEAQLERICGQIAAIVKKEQG